jgi:hypothetical protein
MAIYFDANLLRPWRSFTEPSCLAVSIVARQLGQQIYVPSIAAREAEEGYRRYLEEAFDEFWTGQEKLEKRFEEEFPVHLEPWPDIEQRVQRWRRRLEDFATILRLDDADAHAAFEHEITGTRPAQPRERKRSGEGGRDAAIWLTVARHHAQSGEEGYFLARDKKAFSDGQGNLHPDLAVGLETDAAIKLHESVDDFVAKLGSTAEPRQLSLEELGAEAAAALTEAIEAGTEADYAIWGELDPGYRFHTRIDGAIPTAITAQRRYELGEDAIVLIDSEWALRLACGYQEADTDQPSMWSMIEKLEATAVVQLFLEERDGEFHSAQILTAEVVSDTSLRLSEDGTVLMVTAL